MPGAPQPWGRASPAAPIPLRQPGAGKLGGTKATPVPGIGHLPGDGDRAKAGLSHELSSALSISGELETGPAAASPGQGLMAVRG